MKKEFSSHRNCQRNKIFHSPEKLSYTHISQLSLSKPIDVENLPSKKKGEKKILTYEFDFHFYIPTLPALITINIIVKHTNTNHSKKAPSTFNADILAWFCCCPRVVICSNNNSRTYFRRTQPLWHTFLIDFHFSAAAVFHFFSLFAPLQVPRPRPQTTQFQTQQKKIHKRVQNCWTFSSEAKALLLHTQQAHRRAEKKEERKKTFRLHKELRFMVERHVWLRMTTTEESLLEEEKNKYIFHLRILGGSATSSSRRWKKRRENLIKCKLLLLINGSCAVVVDGFFPPSPRLSKSIIFTSRRLPQPNISTSSVGCLRRRWTGGKFKHAWNLRYDPTWNFFFPSFPYIRAALTGCCFCHVLIRPALAERTRWWEVDVGCWNYIVIHRFAVWMGTTTTKATRMAQI